ncbi:MAG TPA: hypothetical protein VNS63_25220 [Blastocatellia bacterium]|nr:hypothetical protein [Blastocatellia bacterium]
MMGRKPKALTAVFALVLCLAQSARAADYSSDRPALERSVLERLLGNHKVINIVDDFLEFWDKAKHKPLRIQRLIWIRTVESKHREYFDRAVYRGADPEQRRDMLDEFLIRVPERVEAIREFNRTITNTLIVAFVHFKDFRFREYQHRQDVYIGLSFFKFDGAVRPVQNEQGIPDTLCLGAEVLASYTPDQVRVAISHEFFHLYHFGFLFQQAGASPEDFRSASVPLLIEGLAVVGAEDAYLGQSPAAYLHFSDDEFVAQEQELRTNAARYLDLIRSSAPPDEYARWFTQSSDGQIPSRGGYLLGYEVASRLKAAFPLEEIVRMSPAELRSHAEEELAAISGDRVLLMAGSR